MFFNCNLYSKFGVVNEVELIAAIGECEFFMKIPDIIREYLIYLVTDL